ncbi:hypothetical protein LUZ61_017037 [Rhynchospora tenuis]|uniref:NB-ARC domain-containing protein n=1 Tax=Rhynchospora tenuis TaxID=198213 RepID=A0AAD6EKP1_9POAL|nr:hypothetical protein LUZ61_017037 [Rhynchospora tenuis]
MSIAESIAVQGLQWPASEIVSRLIRQGFSYVGMDVPKELTKLETDILPKISIVMKTLPRGSKNNLPELKPWLQRLKDAYYEAEDLLDEAEYQRVAKLVKHEKRKLLVCISSHPVIKPLTNFTHKVSRNLSFMSPQKRKLWRRLTNFKNNVKKLTEDAQFFHGVLQNLSQIASINANTTIVPDTSSLPLNKVFGRDKDRDHVVKLLLEEQAGESSKQNYSVVAVVGRGGAGKTTLAQYVFNDERVVEHFDTRIWVCLKRKLDIIEHTKEMIQSAAKKENLQQSNLDALQYDLRKILLASKNILVVLDDVWYNKNESHREESWEGLMVPFTSIGKCKVLLTSRSAELPVALDARNLIHLTGLEQVELISLFRHYSHLDELCSSNLQIQHELEAIGVKIVEKLGRSPLATKAVASQLRNQRDANVWRRTLEIADFKDSRDALMWSFQQLEEPLQRCFLYCAVFPRENLSRDDCFKIEDGKVIEIPLTKLLCIGEDNQLVTSVPPIRNLGKMSSLHFLPEFHVKKEKGFEIQQLGQLRLLQGHLSIRGLENVQHEAEAAQAKLAEKIGSLGALYALPSLEKLDVDFCPCLDLKKENNLNFGLPSSLQSLEIHLCSISSDILKSNLPCLSTLDFRNCRSAPSLSIGHLTSLRSLQLFNCRDICFLEGLQLLCNLEELRLTRVPKLEVNKSVLESWPGCSERLIINSMQLLKILFALDAYVAPRVLALEYIEEEAITFDSEFESEGSVLYQQLASVKYLQFYKCKTKSLPTNLRSTFSSLRVIDFENCPELSSLPELPESVTTIYVKGCPLLKERNSMIRKCTILQDRTEKTTIDPRMISVRNGCISVRNHSKGCEDKTKAMEGKKRLEASARRVFLQPKDVWRYATVRVAFYIDFRARAGASATSSRCYHVA